MRTISRNCINCQAEFLADAREVNRGNAKFCSRGCFGDYKRKTTAPPPPNVFCSYCHIEFYKNQSKRNKSNSGLYFCTKEHQNKAYKIGLVVPGKKADQLRSRRHKCEGCENLLYRIETKLCNNCKKNKIIKDWLTGDNSVTLNGGKTKETKKFVKEYLRTTRGDKCEVCGWDELSPDGRSIIQMDHVNGNCLDNRQENLKLLCPNHHAMTSTYGSLNKGSGRAHRRK